MKQIDGSSLIYSCTWKWLGWRCKQTWPQWKRRSLWYKHESKYI